MLRRHSITPAICFALIVFACPATDLAAQTADGFQAVVILQRDKHISVHSVDRSFKGLKKNDRGIIVWSQGGADAWQYLAANDQWSPTQEVRVANGASQFAGSRGRGEGGGSGPDLGRLTAQVDQLPAVTVFRGKSFLTPHNGTLLNPRIIVRRHTIEDGSTLPEASAVLKRGQSEITRIAFEAGQQSLRYEQMTELAAKFPNGLPAGNYSLHMADSAESVEFTVDDKDWSDTVMQPSRELAALLSDNNQTLPRQVAVEMLLDQQDETGKPSPYLSDALDVLNSVPEESLSQHLRSIRGQLLRRLTCDGTSTETTNSGLVSTGIPAIDRVRQLIADGHWQEAQDALKRIPDDPRATALAKLHEAVILSQSGLGQTREAYRLFVESVQDVQSFSESDRFLAHNNAANFLLGQAQDRLYNHAFQMAAGVRQPLLTALQFWQQAETNYQRAITLAENLDANQRAGVLVNAARLYVLLADIIRTLDAANADGTRQFTAGEQTAVDIAQSLAFRATATDTDKVEPLILGAAAEVLAQLAFRNTAHTECLEHADQALNRYLDAGSLAGAESVYRMLGLYHRRLAADPNEATRTASAKKAINHFLVSMKLAEVLRDRIPPDQFGLSHAGFFARRVYVNEQVIELLIADGRLVEALHYAEQAKARSLRDLLATQQTHTDAAESGDSRPLSELLGNWPSGVAAVEYFLGAETAWLFVVDTHGDVRVWNLSEAGESSRKLVAKVRRFLTSISGYKRSMVTRLLNGNGFDHTWQDELYAFRQALLPVEALTTLRTAETVVVVPHHILHYFPFAAMVTKRDEQQRATDEMVRPQFLLDESFDLITAPSLAVWDQLHTFPRRPMTQAAAVGIVDYPPLGNRSGPEDLPGVETDLHNASTAFGSRLQSTLSEVEANEASVRKMLARPGLLLFATHGNNVPDQPLLSHLMLHADADDDGLLTARELFEHPIRSDLIVMSACYSGLADRSPMPGDDLFGIQRAFLQSGAASVVSGLWDVYDDTGPILMKDLFDELAKGHPVAKSLAAAQRRFVNTYRASGAADEMFVHPYFWAVYSVAGDERIHFEGRSDAR